MSGKNKSTLSANKMIRQIQESFITREDEEHEYCTPSPPPVHLYLQCPKETEKEVLKTLHLEIRVMTKGSSFQP